MYLNALIHELIDFVHSINQSECAKFICNDLKASELKLLFNGFVGDRKVKHQCESSLKCNQKLSTNESISSRRILKVRDRKVI